MDRRAFCQALLISPLLRSLFLNLKSVRTGGQLYLIHNSPHLFLPKILHELRKFTLSEGKAFAFFDSSPHENLLRKALLQGGWTSVPSPAQASLLLSFRHLHQEVTPSFTLIKEGHVLDIRSKALSSLWTQIQASGPSSRLLTTVCFNNQKALFPPGQEVNIYSEGRLVSTLSLKKDRVKTFNSSKGNITVRIQNRKAWVVQASCSHQVCRCSPPIASAGGQIICAPSHLLVEINGSGVVDTVIG